MKSTSGRRTRSGTGSIYKEAADSEEGSDDSEFEPGSAAEDSSSSDQDIPSSDEEEEAQDDSEDEYNPFGGSDSDDGMW